MPPGLPDTMKDTSMQGISVNDLAALGPEASMGGITEWYRNGETPST